MTSKFFRSFAGLLLCVTLLSFTETRPGGEGFVILVNNKPVLQQFGDDMKVIKTLKLDPSMAKGQLSVRYHHCGKVGKNRTIALKDAKENILRQWKFTDTREAATSMNCNVKEILALINGKHQTVKLFYTSTELPQGRVLVSLASS